MSSKLTCIVGAATLWLVLLTLSVPPVIADPNDLFAPVFVNRPDGALWFSHCDTARYTFKAVSAVTGMPSPFVKYRVVSGPGSIDSITGEWKCPPSYNPDSEVQLDVEIAAREFFLETEGPQNCHLQFRFHNEHPFISLYNSPGLMELKVGQTVTVIIGAFEWDHCDSLNVYLEALKPDFVGEVSFREVGELWNLTLTPSAADSGKRFVAWITASDNHEAVTLPVVLQVLPKPSATIRIATITDQELGNAVDVPVYLEAVRVTGMTGFDLLLAYDDTMLSFQSATIDSSGLYKQCEWEYFTHRYGDNGNCQGDRPSGLIRMVGVAETYNGAHHPSCPPNVPVTPTEMFRIKFMVTHEPDSVCVFSPINFFFIVCSDNSFAIQNESALFVSDSVYQLDPKGTSVTNVTALGYALPSYFGVPTNCISNNYFHLIIRSAMLFGGGVQICPSDSEDIPTDVQDQTSDRPIQFTLHQNYPNPFNPSTTISFDLPHAADVNVEVINVLGQVVWSMSERMNAGTQTLKWDGVRSDGSPVSSGVYYYRLTSDDFNATKKMVLMK